MTLTVETGAGLPDAESYASGAAADAYHGARGNAAWMGETAAKEVALRRATEYLDGLYGPRWAGHAATFDQALHWPRAYVLAPNRAGRTLYLPSDAVPQAIVRACCEAALRELESPGSLTPDVYPGERVVSETVDVLSVDYAPGGSPTDVLPVLVSVGRLVAPLLRSSAGALVMRA